MGPHTCSRVHGFLDSWAPRSTHLLEPTSKFQDSIHISKRIFIILLCLLSAFHCLASAGSRQSGLRQLESPCLLALSEALCEVPSGTPFQLASAISFLSRKPWHAGFETSSSQPGPLPQQGPYARSLEHPSMRYREASHAGSDARAPLLEGYRKQQPSHRRSLSPLLRDVNVDSNG